MIAILFTDGQIKLNEVYDECSQGQWIPVMVYRPKGQPEAPPTVIVCNTEDTAKRFVKRNLDKKWLQGAILLGDEEIKWIKDKGWNIEVIEWPRKILGHPDLNVGFEIIEFAAKPDVHCSRG